jgi:hypothetical protein
MDELTTTVAVIDALGGNGPVGALTASRAPAVSNWRAIGLFPSNTYLALTEALKTVGKTAPASLWSMKPPIPANDQAEAT